MAVADERIAIPPARYYEFPYLPGIVEGESYHRIPLLPVEAHSILVDRAGKPISTVDRLTLQQITEGDGDEAIDFQAVRRRIVAELGTNEDWD